MSENQRASNEELKLENDRLRIENAKLKAELAVHEEPASNALNSGPAPTQREMTRTQLRREVAALKEKIRDHEVQNEASLLHTQRIQSELDEARKSFSLKFDIEALQRDKKGLEKSVTSLTSQIEQLQAQKDLASEEEYESLLEKHERVAKELDLTAHLTVHDLKEENKDLKAELDIHNDILGVTEGLDDVKKLGAYIRELNRPLRTNSIDKQELVAVLRRLSRSPIDEGVRQYVKMIEADRGLLIAFAFSGELEKIIKGYRDLYTASAKSERYLKFPAHYFAPAAPRIVEEEIDSE